MSTDQFLSIIFYSKLHVAFTWGNHNNLYYNHIGNFSVEELGQADFVGVSINNRNTEFCIAPTVTKPRL